METTQQKQVVIYTLLENGIHEFKFLESSVNAIDQWIAKTEELTREVPADTTMRALYDQVQSGMQPAAYAFRVSQAMLKKYPNRAPTRTVFLVNKSFFVSLMQSFISLLRTANKDKVKFFNGDQRAEAIAWLLRDD